MRPTGRPSYCGRRGYPVASGRQQFPIISDGLPTQLPDIDPDETREWVESFDSVVRTRGRARARYVMLRLLERALEIWPRVPDAEERTGLDRVNVSRLAANAAYRYGAQLRNDVRYRNRDWSDVENDLRADLEARYGRDGASTWEKMKAAVRHGWDRATL